MAEIHLHPNATSQISPIGDYLRIGLSSHRNLETLLASGRLPHRRIVVGACRLEDQKDLIQSLKKVGAQIVLDTNAAELSALSVFEGRVKDAPWANVEELRPLGPDDYRDRSNKDIIGKIARFAVQHDVDRVLAPAHYLHGHHRDEWLAVDHTSCVQLRQRLDMEGGKHIGIDYPLIISYGDLREEALRNSLLERLDNLPFDNLWLRTSGFGSDATPVGIQRFITSLQAFHALEKPIIGDYLGGIAGVATVAFGVTSGLSYGIGEKKRFDAGDWDKPRKKKDEAQQGGSTIRVAIAGLDKSLTEKELRHIASARGGYSRIACQDRRCCPCGLDDMIKNWRAHELYQRHQQISRLELLPDERRTRHFLDHDLADVDRQARQIKTLKLSDDGLTMRLQKQSRRMEEIRHTLEHLASLKGGEVRALQIIDNIKSSNELGGKSI